MDMDMHSEQFKCDKCSKCFSTKSGLQWHTHMHGGTSSILCSHCSLNFSLKHNLKRHVSNQYDKYHMTTIYGLAGVFLFAVKQF